MDDHEDSEKRERVLLRPWLENLIEGGSIPGLEWMDDIKTTFKVPWKHRSKKTWSLRHSSIFLEWAKNTGRWSEGDPEPNYAQLKTRLRCAFNKAPDIEEMKELHRTKSEEPYKVYKFIPRKESKLYPFGRRPLRKTTVPITVRRRRYLISRISSGNGGSRFGISDAIHRVKQEKEDITDMNCVEFPPDGGFSVPADSKDWTHSTWHTDKDQVATEIRSGGMAWGSSMYDHEADSSQTVNRILPLIVEEENYSCESFDIDLPPADDSEQKPKIEHSILPQMSREPSSSLQDESMITIPKLLRDDPIAANATSLPFYQSSILPSTSSLAIEKREFCQTYGNTHRHQESSAIYVSSPLVDLPRSDPFSSGDNHRTLLPHVGDYLQDQASKYHGMKQPAASANTFLVSEQWGHGVQGDRQQMKRRSFETSVVHEHPLDQSSESINQESVSEHRPSLPPAARLFPLKNRYYMYQNAFSANSEILPNGDAVPGHRQNAVVKPNSVTQPPIAVATPYDGKPSAEDESLSTGGGVPENINRKLLKKYVESNEGDGQSTEMEVMDLSTKLTEGLDFESKVLDLTKKMVVTPFERDCHVNSSPGLSKSILLDSGKETADSLLSSDPAVLASAVGEVLKFKADYKRKKQLIVTKRMILMEKELELKAREKQLAAREEALFWKESYLHRVMAGTDIGPIPNIATNLNGGPHAGGPFSSVFEASMPVGRVGSNEMKDASSGISHLTFPHLQQTSPIIMSAAAAIRNRIPVAAAVTLARPEPPAFMPYYQLSSRPIRPHVSSVTSGPPASLFSLGPVSMPMNTARLREVCGPNLAQKATGCTVLPPVKQSVGNETTDPGLEPEANVALGDANPGRKPYKQCFSAEKAESEMPVSLGTVEEVPSQSLMMVRKRGRPKGSKNKLKLARLSADSSLRQMPPLLIIRSQPPSKDSVGLDPATPFHLLRNDNVPGIALNTNKSTEASSAVGTQESNREQHHTTVSIGSSSSNYSASRILPPVISSSSGDCSSPRYGVPTPDVSNSTPSTSASHSLFDHLPNREIMPETVRQLLMSASKPVGNILPPLSPPKSPEEFAHEIIPADTINLCN